MRVGTEFIGFPKIFRYSREVIVTEKLDGTNACVIVEDGKLVGCQSRSRLITPEDDNYGFAAWAKSNADFLASTLGDGYHFGEWWGQGIQRKYDQTRKWFSLFNVSRWSGLQNNQEAKNIGLSVVPTLFTCTFDFLDVETHMDWLKKNGSKAAPGFLHPEGIVIYHTQGNFLLKKTFEKDVEGKNHGA